MIEFISGFPDDVVAVTAKGRVTRRDYESVLIPAVDGACRRHGKVSLYYEIGPQFSGIDAAAAWEDFKVGVEHWRSWERIAIVTEVEWIRQMIRAFGFLLPGRVKVFPIAQAAEAREWTRAA